VPSRVAGGVRWLWAGDAVWQGEGASDVAERGVKSC
jgi:hypothetical protein